jgi:hypothetical protein
MTSKIKVDNINKVSDDSNIIKKCGTTITLGASGDSIALASGASQTGFGRTGTVDWQTGSIKTATFTAANGEGYFANTAGGAFTMNLPAGSAGAIVSVQDYNNTFDTHALTVDANGSEKINGGDGGEPITLDTEGRGVTFVYIDATVGWRSVQDNDFTKKGQSAAFIAATGGTITTVCTNFKVHTFTGPGTFCVSNAGNTAGSNKLSYLVVAGGGGSGQYYGGAGGGGGFRESKSPETPYTASPLDETNGLTVTATGFPITVGSGGAKGGPSYVPGVKGSDSVFSSITSTGGGFGGGSQSSGQVGGPGGSGGGGGGTSGGAGGTGNTPPVSPPQGKDGYTAGGSIAGAGGGATVAGGTNPDGKQGGVGATTSINNTPTAYAGGGGGGPESPTSISPCGSAGANVTGTPAPLRDGQTNKGGGGGADGGAGGSGVVIIRYKFQ